MPPQPTLNDIAKAICCPDPAKRCRGQCDVAAASCMRQAIAVRDEYQKAAHWRLDTIREDRADT